MTRQIQQTSIDSYNQTKATNISEQQQTVLIYFHIHPDSTDMEIAQEMGVDSDVVRPRRYELVNELGLMEQSGKRPCKVTGRLSLTWRVK